MEDYLILPYIPVDEGENKSANVQFKVLIIKERATEDNIIFPLKYLYSEKISLVGGMEGH